MSANNNYSQTTLEAIKNKQARVCVMGLGYVGLPLVHLFVKTGYQVVGFDIDEEKIKLLNDKQSYIKHIGPEIVSMMVESGRFHATADPKTLREVDALIVCVPTP